MATHTETGMNLQDVEIKVPMTDQNEQRNEKTNNNKGKQR